MPYSGTLTLLFWSLVVAQKKPGREAARSAKCFGGKDLPVQKSQICARENRNLSVKKIMFIPVKRILPFQKTDEVPVKKKSEREESEKWEA